MKKQFLRATIIQGVVLALAALAKAQTPDGGEMNVDHPILRRIQPAPVPAETGRRSFTRNPMFTVTGGAGAVSSNVQPSSELRALVEVEFPGWTSNNGYGVETRILEVRVSAGLATSGEQSGSLSQLRVTINPFTFGNTAFGTQRFSSERIDIRFGGTEYRRDLTLGLNHRVRVSLGGVKFGSVGDGRNGDSLIRSSDVQFYWGVIANAMGVALRSIENFPTEGGSDVAGGVSVFQATGTLGIVKALNREWSFDWNIVSGSADVSFIMNGYGTGETLLDVSSEARVHYQAHPGAVRVTGFIRASASQLASRDVSVAHQDFTFNRALAVFGGLELGIF